MSRGTSFSAAHGGGGYGYGSLGSRTSKRTIFILILLVVVILLGVFLGLALRKKRGGGGNGGATVPTDEKCRKLVELALPAAGAACPAGFAAAGSGPGGKRVCARYAPIGQSIGHVTDIAGDDGEGQVGGGGGGRTQVGFRCGADGGYRALAIPQQSVQWQDDEGRVAWNFGMCIASSSGGGGAAQHYADVRVSQPVPLQQLVPSAGGSGPGTGLLSAKGAAAGVCGNEFGKRYAPVGVLWHAPEGREPTVGVGRDGASVRDDLTNRRLVLRRVAAKYPDLEATVVCAKKNTRPCQED
jgi:hypothetical protein